MRGTYFEIRKNLLQRVPGAKLAKVDELGDECFNRNPETFAAIINYYRTGSLHMPRVKTKH